MEIYKVIFVKNEPMHCVPVGNIVLDGSYHFEHSNGRLIYAIIKADNEEAAIDIARTLADKVKERII